MAACSNESHEDSYEVVTVSGSGMVQPLKLRSSNDLGSALPLHWCALPSASQLSQVSQSCI